MPFTGPMEDRLAIRELYDSYADAANRMDRAEWLACWTDDAQWWTHYFDLAGQDAIAAQYDLLMGSVATSLFTTQICAIESAGDTASGRAMCSERLLMHAGGEHRLSGIYHDELRREGGTWRFSRRVYKVLTEEMGQ